MQLFNPKTATRVLFEGATYYADPASGVVLYSGDCCALRDAAWFVGAADKDAAEAEASRIERKVLAKARGKAAVITDDGWTLTDKTGAPIAVGQTVTDFRGETTTLKGGRPPAGAGKSGYVWTTDGAEFYPTVFDLRWVSPDGRYFGDGK